MINLDGARSSNLWPHPNLELQPGSGQAVLTGKPGQSQAGVSQQTMVCPGGRDMAKLRQALTLDHDWGEGLQFRNWLWLRLIYWPVIEPSSRPIAARQSPLPTPAPSVAGQQG